MTSLFSNGGIKRMEIFEGYHLNVGIVQINLILWNFSVITIRESKAMKLVRQKYNEATKLAHKLKWDNNGLYDYLTHLLEEEGR